VLPVEVKLEVLVDVPVESDVRGEEPVGSEVGVCQTVLEDMAADIHEVVPACQLPGSPSALTFLQAERVARLDEAHAATGLSRQQVAPFDIIALNGQVSSSGQIARQGIR